MRVGNKLVISFVVCFLVTLSSSLCFAGGQATREMTLEQKVQRSLDYQEIQNVMSKHEYYHALTLNNQELDDLWVKKTPNPTFAQNQGYWIGYKSIRYYYGTLNEMMKQSSLNAICRNNPNIKNTKENLAMGTMMMHTLTTPIIVVAGDGKTAKGMWYSPGQVTMVGPDGKGMASWIWEKYGADFVKEDGQWKIWHLHMYTDFMTPVGESWVKTTKDAPVGSEGSQPKPDDGGIAMPKPDKEEITYKTYSPTQVPQNAPRMPEPYWTFSETFSY
ncbi:MAG: hypothetical protein H6Q67_1598 [Firmicutes bacterium]|nr:hypothetical protein [Bacillota bacterium]